MEGLCGLAKLSDACDLVTSMKVWEKCLDFPIFGSKLNSSDNVMIHSPTFVAT
jgi:hypothetical protein